MPTKDSEIFESMFEEYHVNGFAFRNQGNQKIVIQTGVPKEKTKAPTDYVSVEEAIKIFMYLRPIDTKDTETFLDSEFKACLEFDLLGVKIKDKEDIIHFVAKNLIDYQYGEIDDMDDLEVTDKKLRERGLLDRINDGYATFY